MSFTKNTFFRIVIPIGLLVLIIGCLLAFHSKAQKMNTSQTVATALPLSIASSSDATDSTEKAAATGVQTPETGSNILHANDMTFEVVTTSAAQQQGLGGRAIIPDNYAMLFVFPVPDLYGFWMKDMLTSIDMIWLSDNGTIIAINGSVSPATYPNVFYPPQPVKYVLETRAGFAAEKGWEVGTNVMLPPPY